MATVLSFIVSIERPFWMMNTKAEMLHIKHAEMVVDKPTRETVPIPTKRETLYYLDFGCYAKMAKNRKPHIKLAKNRKPSQE